MSSAKDVILGQLEAGRKLIEMFTADLSDEEYFKPAVEGTNHVAWMLGHLACIEDAVAAGLTGTDKRIPAATHELFEGGSRCIADPSEYPSRRQIDEMFRNTRAHFLEALKAAEESNWDAPAPEGSPVELFPTVGALWGMPSIHQFWHIGQIATCRATMNKKRVID